MTTTKTTPRRGITDPAATAGIDAACRDLRLPTIRARAGEFAAAAEREHATYAGFLAELLLAECDDRDARRKERRIRDAGFPRAKRIEDFDYAANPNINPATIATLAAGNWIAAGSPLCLIGDSGTGKSHLLIGLGTAAATLPNHAVATTPATRHRTPVGAAALLLPGPLDLWVFPHRPAALRPRARRVARCGAAST